MKYKMNLVSAFKIIRQQNKVIKYSFCESVTAGPLSPWHIRTLTEKGQKLGGGADTVALCGRTVCWDLKVDLSTHHLNNSACKKCVTEYDKLK